MEVIIRGRLHNQIAEFFNNQHGWKDLMDILDILCEDICQGQAATEIFFFDWVWQILSLIQLDCRIFVLRDNYQVNVVSDTTILVTYGQMCPSSNQIAEFFDH